MIDFEPQGDPACHLPRAALDSGLRALPPAPADAGTVRLIVRRNPDHSRETPQRVTLTPDGGVPGDNWFRREPRNPEAQIALRFVSAKETRHHNLRGIYWKVIEPGDVAVGDEIVVLNRPTHGEETCL